MRRRGRAQDSTEGPDGPRLGYGPLRGIVAMESDHGLTFLDLSEEPDLMPATVRACFDRAREAVAAMGGARYVEGMTPIPAAWRRVDAVRSGRERLGE